MNNSENWMVERWNPFSTMIIMKTTTHKNLPCSALVYSLSGFQHRWETFSFFPFSALHVRRMKIVSWLAFIYKGYYGSPYPWYPNAVDVLFVQCIVKCIQIHTHTHFMWIVNIRRVKELSHLCILHIIRITFRGRCKAQQKAKQVISIPSHRFVHEPWCTCWSL